MNTRHPLSLPIFALLPIFAFSTTADSQTTTDTIRSAEHGISLEVEIVSTQALRRKGLMHRTHLGANQGMLFSYSDQAPRSVWMKNTLLSLDVLFLSSDGRIVAMQENLQPCPHTPCPVFSSVASAMYMLEVNADYIKNHDLKVGDRLRLP